MSKTSKNILYLRSNGMTQTEIAKQSGVPQCRISRWEKGDVAKAADDALCLDELARAMRAKAAKSEPNQPQTPTPQALAATETVAQGV